MKSLATLALVLTTTVFGSPSHPWKCDPPADEFSYENRNNPISPSDIYEIPSPKLFGAVSWYIGQVPFLGIDNDHAKSLTGEYYRCPSGKRPFVLRALYAKSGSGGFQVFRHGTEILVISDHLGGILELEESAVIVNLDFTPTKIYVSVATAE